MKKILITAAAIFLAALIAAGGFWGGMAYQSNRAEQARTDFINARGGQLTGDGQFPGAGQLPEVDPPASAPGSFGNRGTAGQVKSIDGNVMTISTAQDVITVDLSDSTQIVKTVSGGIADLQPGIRVLVTGQKDGDGNIAAEQIQILNSDPAGAAGPVAPGMEP